MYILFYFFFTNYEDYFTYFFKDEYKIKAQWAESFKYKGKVTAATSEVNTFIIGS